MDPNTQEWVASRAGGRFGFRISPGPGAMAARRCQGGQRVIAQGMSLRLALAASVQECSGELLT
jgi:hypothetical protein